MTSDRSVLLLVFYYALMTIWYVSKRKFGQCCPVRMTISLSRTQRHRRDPPSQLDDHTQSSFFMKLVCHCVKAHTFKWYKEQNIYSILHICVTNCILTKSTSSKKNYFQWSLVANANKVHILSCKQWPVSTQWCVKRQCSRECSLYKHQANVLLQHELLGLVNKITNCGYLLFPRLSFLNLLSAVDVVLSAVRNGK